MSIELYEKALRRFCETRGLGEPCHLMQGGLLSIDGYPMRIAFIEASDRCRITVDLGPPPEQVELACCRLLLQFNHRGDALHGPVMSLDPLNGHIELGVVLDASQLDGAEILDDVIEHRLGDIIDAWEEALDAMQPPPATGGDTAGFPVPAQH